MQISRCQQHRNEKIYEYGNLPSRILTIRSCLWRMYVAWLTYVKLYYLLQKDHAASRWHTFLPLSTSPFLSVFQPFQSQKLFVFLLQAMPIVFSHAFGVFHPVWLQHSPTNMHNGWRCKSPLPLLAPSVTQVCWPGNFQGFPWQSGLQTDSDTFGGSDAFATRGGEEQQPSVEIYWLAEDLVTSC